MGTQWGRNSAADVCLQPALPGSARTRRLRRARPQALNVIRCSPALVAGTGQPSKRAREAEGGSAQEARGSKRWRELPAGLAGTQVGMQATSLQAVSACGSMQVTLLGRHAPVGMHQSACTSWQLPKRILPRKREEARMALWRCPMSDPGSCPPALHCMHLLRTDFAQVKTGTKHAEASDISALLISPPRPPWRHCQQPQLAATT